MPGLSLGAGTAIAAGISALGGLIGGTTSNIMSGNLNERNIAFQRQENEITRQREDNAVQRRALDLQRAGLSKTLSAGSPASAQALTAPRDERTYVNPIERAIEKMNLQNLVLQNAQARADIALKDAQKTKTESETTGQNISNGNAMENFSLHRQAVNAEVELKASQVKLNEANAALADKKGYRYADMVDAEIDKILADIKVSGKSYDLLVEQVTRQILENGNLVKYGEKLDKETELLVEDIAQNKLQQKILDHNLLFANFSGLPVGQIHGRNEGIFGEFAGLPLNLVSGSLSNVAKLGRGLWNFGKSIYSNWKSNH